MYKTSSGFTIIELSLAMTFVSILLIAVAMLSIQLTNQYSRGLTLKEVAQAGTEAANDMKRTLGQSQLMEDGIQVASIVNGGRVLCTGTYSYVANDPTNLAENNGGTDSPNAIKLVKGTNKIAVRLAKVRDEGGSYCNGGLNDAANKEIMQTDVAELLPAGSRLLVVRGLTVSPNGIPSTGAFADEFSQGRGIYTVNLTIGTGVNTELVSTTNCRPPSDQASNLEFCAIDTFTFTTRVGSSNR